MNLYEHSYSGNTIFMGQYLEKGLGFGDSKLTMAHGYVPPCVTLQQTDNLSGVYPVSCSMIPDRLTF